MFNESRLFHFFFGDWVDDCVGLVPLRPIVIYEGDGHVGGFHSAEVVLRQVAGQESLRVGGHTRR
jgi:hypothetical protein